MTLDITKLRAETLALLDGTTPGPWRTNATILHGKKYGGMWVEAPELIRITGSGGSQSYTHVVTDTQIHDDNDANARLIAAAPKLAADTLRLLDEIERLTAENNKLRDDMSGGSFYQEDDIDAMQNEIERLREATNQSRLAFAGYVSVESAVRKLDALAEGGPDDR